MKKFKVNKLEKNVVWSIQMPRSMYDRLQGLAEETGKSRSQIVREMVEFCFEELEPKKL